MTDAPQEAIDAALALVRRMETRFLTDAAHYDEARRIAALLPKPVDSAVLACREIVAAEYATSETPFRAAQVKEGSRDAEWPMTVALAAYHAGQAAKETIHVD